VPRRLRVPLLRELDPLARGVLSRHDLNTRNVPEPLGIDTVERIGHIGFAAPHHQRTRRRVGNTAHHQCLDVWHPPPIAGKGLQFDLDSRLVTDEFVGAGADRMLLEAVVRYLFGTTMPAALAVVP
jgi:hypothetical protein